VSEAELAIQLHEQRVDHLHSLVHERVELLEAALAQLCAEMDAHHAEHAAMIVEEPEPPLEEPPEEVPDEPPPPEEVPPEEVPDEPPPAPDETPSVHPLFRRFGGHQ
jgi:hypothetical protein